jgi:hypothetical protein
MNHFGLFFTPEQAHAAGKHRAREPYGQAWALLDGQPPLDLMASTVWNGLRWKLSGDPAAGQRAVDNLLQTDFEAASSSALSGLRRALGLCHAIELVRDHPDLSAANRARLMVALDTLTESLTTVDLDFLPVQAWISALHVVAGIVLDDLSRFERGADGYRAVIDHEIHPDGYLQSVIKQPDAFRSTLLTVHGLILAAEAARHQGVDLWGHSKRGVSVATAALYPLYYYYYPEKWPWDETLTVDDTQPPFKTHAVYLEMLNLHINRPTRAIDLILAETRPAFDACGGGLATLTHAVAPRRGLFG